MTETYKGMWGAVIWEQRACALNPGTAHHIPRD